MIKLYNGIEIPEIGYGTCDIFEEKTIIDALKAGYRLIDTASHYYNEDIVGSAIRESEISRDKIFVVTKLWYSDMGYESAIEAFEQSMERLQLSYVDLYLIHWPAAADKYPDWEKTNMTTWEALEYLYKSKRVRAIGVSNFMQKHLVSLLGNCSVKPMVNQIECHPGFWQKDVVELCQKHDIQVMAWSPLGTGEILDNNELKILADKYRKTSAQICLRWNMQHSILPIPKTKGCTRMKENLDIFDITISKDDMKIIDFIPFCGGQGAIVK